MVGLVLLAAAPFAIGWLYQRLGSFRDTRRFPPLGRLCNGLHIKKVHNSAQCTTPGITVVLEAGIAGSSVSWQPVLAEVAHFADVVSYDRAGLGWSEPARSPRTLHNIVQELHNLLHNAQVTAPWLLVGHSFGGLVIRQFAAQYPAEVAGLLFVDAVPVSDWFPLTDANRRRLARGVQLSRRGATLARFGVVRFALARLLSGSRALPRLLAKFSAGQGASVADGLTREVRKLPPELWPVVQAHWCQPKCFRAMADYLSALPANSEAAAALAIPPGIPALALCSDYEHTEPIPGVAYRRVENCGHWIQLDHPKLVAGAIAELLAVSRRSPARPEQSAACAEAALVPPSSPPPPECR